MSKPNLLWLILLVTLMNVQNGIYFLIRRSCNYFCVVLHASVNTWEYNLRAFLKSTSHVWISKVLKCSVLMCGLWWADCLYFGLIVVTCKFLVLLTLACWLMSFEPEAHTQSLIITACAKTNVRAVEFSYRSSHPDQRQLHMHLRIWVPLHPVKKGRRWRRETSSRHCHWRMKCPEWI